MRGEPRDALDLVAVVGLRVAGVAGAVVFCARAKVDSAGELADEGEAHVAADRLFERGDGDEGGGGEEAGAEVAEGGELLAEFEEALFGADGAGAPFLEREWPLVREMVMVLLVV